MSDHRGFRCVVPGAVCRLLPAAFVTCAVTRHAGMRPTARPAAARPSAQATAAPGQGPGGPVSFPIDGAQGRSSSLTLSGHSLPAVPVAMVDGTQQHTVLVDGKRSAHNGGRDLTTDACAQVRHAEPPPCAGVSRLALCFFPVPRCCPWRPAPCSVQPRREGVASRVLPRRPPARAAETSGTPWLVTSSISGPRDQPSPLFRTRPPTHTPCTPSNTQFLHSLTRSALTGDARPAA